MRAPLTGDCARLPAAGRHNQIDTGDQAVQDAMLKEPPIIDSAHDAGGDSAPSVDEVLRAALAPIAPRIDAAFIYGPMARTVATAHGHIDVMIIGRGISYTEVIPLFIAAAKFLGRTINPSVYSAADWSRKRADGNRVILAVLKQHKIFLVGSTDGIPQPR